MSITASAVILPEPGRVEVREVELPDPGPDEVEIRTVFSGISPGTERWVLTGRYNHMADDVAGFYPCSPGYQAAGIVERVGSDVTSVAPGDAVLTDGTKFCDPSIKQRGPTKGPHVSRHVEKAAQVTRLPAGTDLAAASLFRLASVSRHGVRLTKVQQGELVVVIGQGMIGQMSAQAARRAGARVIASDLVPQRVELSARYSADRAVDASHEDLRAVVQEEAPRGADVVIDTTGSSTIFPFCRDLVRDEGRIALQGYYPDPISIDFHPSHLKHLTVTFPCGWDTVDDPALAEEIGSGGVTITPLITHRFAASDAAKAYQLILDHPEDSLGVVLSWTDN
jgi:2-desacetyl-2-hydroxyethyl bacteriochlorophyllide A dehydrogenase